MEAEEGIYKKPILMKRIVKVRKHIFMKVAGLTVSYAKSDEPIPFEGIGSLRFRRIRPGRIWGKAFACAWFRFAGKVPQSAAGKHIVLIVDVDGEGVCVDGNNEPFAAVTSTMCWVDRVQSTNGKILVDYLPRCAGGEDVGLLVDAGFNGKIIQPYFCAVFKRACIAACRDDIRDFYYDFVTASFFSAAASDKRRESEIDACLGRAYAALKDYSPENVAEAKRMLQPVLAKRGGDGESRLTFTAVGHSHLDLAWLWPLRETRRKAVRTFTTALNNIAKYPGYVYGASQPQQFDWIRRERPRLYERIKRAVAEGSIEPQGGMWVECDTNIPCGESLVRQILYGKEFFRSEFGQDMRICWLPDVFGYSANLPQILRKTGIEYFMTIKLSWNEHNQFPHKTFVWEAIDGSSVLVHMAPEGDYNSGGTPLCVKRAAELFTEKDRLNEALLVFGAGDGGGGPGEAHLELLSRQGDVAGFPKVRFGRAIDFFDRLREKRGLLATHRGELYLEKHQGTYTTQARNKKNNRRMELMLHDLEFLSAAAYLRGKPYPAELLETVWKETLLYQFHDIIPGSSITRVYRESCERYKAMAGQLREAAGLAARQLGAGGGGLSFVNSSPFPRSPYIKHEGVWYKGNAGPYAAGRLEATGPVNGLAFTADTIENERLRVRFAPGGEIASLADKANGKEYCGGYLNRLVLYTDKWLWYNAWDIDIGYTKKRKVTLRPVHTETFLDGPRVVRRNRYRHGRTTLTQEVSLTAGGEAVEFDTACGWHELFRMLRADFKPAVYSGRVKCDIQFGSFDRSTGEETSVERAQFEICAHKWVDVSDGERGLALLNDCKYGHRVKSGLISLNLLRSPVYPDPKADRGEQRFRYALYPHEGGAFESGLIRLGYEFNIEPLVFPGEIALPPLFEADCDNIVLETVKKAEKRGAIVLRAYEAHGKATTAAVKTSVACRACLLADMLEKPIGEADLGALSFGPFETKTILLEL